MSINVDTDKGLVEKEARKRAAVIVPSPMSRDLKEGWAERGRPTGWREGEGI